ncbi:hypothetical protein MAPG_08674 [Magnaporthiopsis poae ATCC 64411]|uniref:Uncharacterized protein n=1 Tax=Magnaporthiopsis poae (strain ATCC 64411 / 73-15) TaxID=644358 RepID=A0A0C4E7Z1_MAGP6|nr:hypothetical protein MAPG_08674 [Magnaporthiopsis poae ATCC 64411]
MWRSQMPNGAHLGEKRASCLPSAKKTEEEREKKGSNNGQRLTNACDVQNSRAHLPNSLELLDRQRSSRERHLATVPVPKRAAPFRSQTNYQMLSRTQQPRGPCAETVAQGLASRPPRAGAEAVRNTPTVRGQP